MLKYIMQHSFQAKPEYEAEMNTDKQSNELTEAVGD